MNTPITLKITGKQSIALILLAVTVASYTLTLFYITAMSTITLADATTTYPTTQPSLVITGPAIMPQTSIINQKKTLQLTLNLPGVTGIEYQDLALVQVNNKTTVIRGLEPAKLQKIINTKESVEGCVWLSQQTMENLGLSNGSIFTAYSPMSHRHLILQVCGTHSAPWPLSDEIITTMETAGYLRGIHPWQASIAIIYFNNTQTRNQALAALGITPQQRSLLAKALTALRYGYIPPEAIQSFTNRLLGTLNLDKTIITGILLGLTIIVSTGMTYVGALAYNGEREKFEVLHILGYSHTRIKISYSLLLLTLGTIASLLGLTLAITHAQQGVIHLLGYTIPAIYNGGETIIVALLPAITLATGVLLGEGSE